MTRTDLGDPQIINPTDSESQYCQIVFNILQQGVPSFSPNFPGFFEREGVGSYDIETRIINSTLTYKELWWGVPSPPPPPTSYTGPILIREEWSSSVYGGGAAGTRYMGGRVEGIRGALNNFWGANHPNVSFWDVKYRYKIIYSSCPDALPLFTPTPIFAPIFIYRQGTASPPPPLPRNMCGCDCNTIASIIAEQMVEKQRLLDALKEHIDSRTVEQLKYINEMLQAVEMDLDLQPVIDEIKRAEANLWNGINGG